MIQSQDLLGPAYKNAESKVNDLGRRDFMASWAYNHMSDLKGDIDTKKRAKGMDYPSDPMTRNIRLLQEVIEGTSLPFPIAVVSTNQLDIADILMEEGFEWLRDQKYDEFSVPKDF